MNEHNPIAQEISKIQEAWLTQVSPDPHARIVRLIIHPTEARIYEGFCRLESSAHATLPEIFFTQFTPFLDEDTYSAALAADWLNAFDKNVAEMQQAGIHWNPASFRTALEDTDNDHHLTLLHMLHSFRQSFPDPDAQIVLALLPRQVADIKGMKRWLQHILQTGIPAHLKLLIIDHIGKYHFELSERQFPCQLQHLTIPLQVSEAVHKIATGGNPNDPEVQLRKCIFEMGKALQARDIKSLRYWGQRALDCTQKSGNKGLFSSAHIMYAGMLFYYKRDPQIPLLLEKGMRIAKQGHQQQDPACLPLLIQYHGYHGAYAQLRRRYNEAIDWYIKQGEMASQYVLPQLATNAYYQAAELCRRKATARYHDTLELAYRSGDNFSDDEIYSSVYMFILRDYYDYVYTQKRMDLITSIELKMTRLLGPQWREEVDRLRKAKTPMGMQAQALHTSQA